MLATFEVVGGNSSRSDQTGTHFSDDFVTAIARVIGVVKF